MEKDKAKFSFGESLDATIDTSVAEANHEDSVNYQTADEENSSKYYSVIEDNSILENISNSSLTMRIDKESPDVFQIAGESSVDRPFVTDFKTLNILDSLSAMDVESVNKFNIHETVETDEVLRPSMDIFDDNESSVDGHELIIDDDPQPDEKSDDCLESGAEMSTDMQYVEDTSESIDSSKNLGFGLSKKMYSEETPELTLQETKTSCSEDLDDSPKQIVDVKIFTDDSGDAEMKSESYNFPEGSHRVTLVIDGNNVEAINIGQNIYIYTDSNGELTAFQVIKDNGNPSIKYLHVGKNEDGNIEVYEEQVNQITITPENADFAKEKEISSTVPNSDAGKTEQKSSAEIEKTSQDLIKAVMNQEKLFLSANSKDQLFINENKTSLLSEKETPSKVDHYKNCKVMLNDKLKSSNENDSSLNASCEIFSKTSLLVPKEANHNKKNILERKENSIIDSISKEKLTSFYFDQSVDHNENEKKTNKTLTDNFSLEVPSKLDNCKHQESKIESLNVSKLESVTENNCEKVNPTNNKNLMENESISQSIQKIMSDSDRLRKISSFGKDNFHVTNENLKNKSNSSELKINDISANFQKSPSKNLNDIDNSVDAMKVKNTNVTVKSYLSDNKVEGLQNISVIDVSTDKPKSEISSEINKDQLIIESKSDSVLNSLDTKEVKSGCFKIEKALDNKFDKVKESNFKDDKLLADNIKKDKLSPFHNVKNTECPIDSNKKLDFDKQKSSPIERKREDITENIKTDKQKQTKDSLSSNSQPANLSNSDSQINIESDDEEEYIEGEPVTGDSGIDWSDGNAQNDASKSNSTIAQTDQTDKDNLFNSVENSESIESDKLSDDSNNLLIIESNIPNEVSDENITKTQTVLDVKEKILVIDSSESSNILKNVSLIENDCTKDKNEDIVNAEEIENILNDSCSNADDEMNEETVTLHIVDSNVSTGDMNDLTSTFVTKQVVLDYGKSQEYITKACEPEDLNESFENFRHKTPLKTYSREVKPILSSNKGLSNVSIKLTPQITVCESKPNDLKESPTLSKKTVPYNKNIEIIALEESVCNAVEESVDVKVSPRQKSRQPRKQVFTTVAKSDIEIIFSGSDEIKEQNVPKSAKTYSRSKHKETSFEKLKPNISNSIKNEDKKVLNTVSKVDYKKEIKNVIESSLIENNQKPITDSVEKNPEIAKKEDNEKTTIVNIDKPNDIREDEKTNSVSNSPLSNSAKRKRGRPKKILSPNTSVFESVILNVDGSLRNPLTKTPVEAKTVCEKEPEVKSKDEIEPIKEEAINVPQYKNESEEKVEEKNTDSVEETGKRKKGRPKKILSLSFDESNDLKRKSLSDLDCNKSSSFRKSDLVNSENVCPICSKNFRSPNVLLKHAKHCNGVINLEAFKSPKRKKIENASEVVDESKTDDLSISQESQKFDTTDVDSSNIENKEIDDSINSTSDVLNDTSTIEITMPENRKSTPEPELQTSTDKVEDKSLEIITIDDEKLPEKITENDPVDTSNKEDVSNESNTTSKSSKLDDTKSKARLTKKLDNASKLSPMSRLSKFLSTKPPVNKVIKCEICNKTFRQLAHMVYHRNKHDEEKLTDPIPQEKPVPKPNEQQVQKSECDAILKCEICKKGFRKLHHLVEHREVHEVKSRRASTVSVKSEPEAGFRCDTCDKSFRKLHHLVSHRELHLSEGSEIGSKPIAETKHTEKEVEKDDATCTGCGKSFRKRHHMIEHRDTHCSPKKKRLSEDSEFSENNVRLSITSSTSDETNNCGICGKSYRKLHHMIEHRESHAEAVVKSEHRVSTRFSSPDSLNTKDIIHECSKCYMVFPNVNSLNKHIENCTRKKIFGKKPVVNAISKSNKSLVKNSNSETSKVSKLPKFEDIEKPSTSKVVKSKPSTQKSDTGTSVVKPITRTKFRSSENDVKYKINPAFKGKVENGEPSNSLSKSKPKPYDSILAGLKVPSARMLKTIIEETTVKYSFPKSPKAVGRPKNDSKLPKSTLRKSIATKTNNKPTLTIRRRSLGGRKSLEIKRTIREPETRQKLQRKTISSIDTNKNIKNTKESCKCDCGKQFDNNTLLKKHMDTEHTPPKSYKCHICGVSVRTAVQFSKHKKSHEDSHTAQSAQNKKNRASASSASTSAKSKGVTPRRDTKKLKDAHRGVPLSDKMKKAFAGSKF